MKNIILLKIIEVLVVVTIIVGFLGIVIEYIWYRPLDKTIDQWSRHIDELDYYVK